MIKSNSTEISFVCGNQLIKINRWVKGTELWVENALPSFFHHYKLIKNKLDEVIGCDQFDTRSFTSYKRETYIFM